MADELSERQKRLLSILREDPKRKWSFVELGDKFNTSASAIVSMIRSLAKKGHGEFRDQVMGEKYLPQTPERIKMSEQRRMKKYNERRLGIGEV